jgi:hypothetical protein
MSNRRSDRLRKNQKIFVMAVDCNFFPPNFCRNAHSKRTIFSNVRGRTDTQAHRTIHKHAHVNHVEKVLDSMRDRNANFATISRRVSAHGMWINCGWACA